MEFTIDLTIKESRALRVIAKTQGVSIENLLRRLIRQYATGQIRGEYRKLFDQMNYNQLEAVFGTIEDLFGWSSSSSGSSRSSSRSSRSSSSMSKSSASSESSSKSSSKSSRSSGAL